MCKRPALCSAKSDWCGYCKTDTPKQDYPVKQDVVAHVCQCCNLTTSVTEKNTTFNIVIRDKEEVDV